jgi:uncharacterized LabA/DUF88 family protein
MSGTYFFIDGSALTAQIRQLWRIDPSLVGRKLCPKLLIRSYMGVLRDLHSNGYKRATFYFPIGDEIAVDEFLVMPDHQRPGEIRDLHFKFCGQKLKRSAEFREFVETTVPPKFRDRCSKSEKGIDIEICCDAFRLASASQLDRIFLFTNDDDFIPFCRTIKDYGANISIIHLSDRVSKNQTLLRAADTYDVLSMGVLQQLFLPLPDPAEAPTAVLAPEPPASDLKSDADPSDMLLDRPVPQAKREITEKHVLKQQKRRPLQTKRATKGKGGKRQGRNIQ